MFDHELTENFLPNELLEYLWENDSHFMFSAIFLSKFKIIEHGDWISEGKTQSCTTIVQYLADSTYWAQHQSRSGSYHSEYIYDEPVVVQVKPVQTQVTEWVACGLQ